MKGNLFNDMPAVQNSRFHLSEKGTLAPIDSAQEMLRARLNDPFGRHGDLRMTLKA